MRKFCSQNAIQDLFLACPSLRSGRAGFGVRGQGPPPSRLRRDRPFGAPSASLTQSFLIHER